MSGVLCLVPPFNFCALLGEDGHRLFARNSLRSAPISQREPRRATARRATPCPWTLVWTLDSTPAIINVGSLVLCLRGLGSSLLPLLPLRVRHCQSLPPVRCRPQSGTLEDLAIPQIRWFCIFLPLLAAQTTKFSLASSSAETMPLPLPFPERGVIVHHLQPRARFASLSGSRTK